MAPSDFFEDYLYKKFRAVFVDTMSETAVSLGLSDVLIKNGSESQGWFSSSLPVLVRCGSMGDVGTFAKPEDQQRLQDGLHQFDECTRQNLAPTYDEKLFQWVPAHAGLADRKFGSSASLKMSLLAGGFGEAEAHFSESNNITMRIENMETASVDKKKIADLVKKKLWRPDPTELWATTSTCCAPAFRLRPQKHKVWVVHQILFASKLTVTSAASASGGAKLTCHIVPGTPGGAVEITRNPAEKSITLSDPRIDSKYPGKIMFAFRAQCFLFNDAGEYVDMKLDAGRHLPVAAASYHDEDDRHDKDRSGIRDLFLESAPSDVDSDDETCLDLRPLPIRERPVQRDTI